MYALSWDGRLHTLDVATGGDVAPHVVEHPALFQPEGAAPEAQLLSDAALRPAIPHPSDGAVEVAMSIPQPPVARPAIQRPAGDPVRILFFGAIKGYKGVDVLVRAGIELMRAAPGCRIDIVGRPFQDLAEERAMIAAAGLEDRFGLDLRYVPDEDLARYLAQADIAVFPYREIDASGAFALAVAQGLPIVASAIGVFKEPPASAHVRLVPPHAPAPPGEPCGEFGRDRRAGHRIGRWGTGCAPASYRIRSSSTGASSGRDSSVSISAIRTAHRSPVSSPCNTGLIRSAGSPVRSARSA